MTITTYLQPGLPPHSNLYLTASLSSQSNSIAIFPSSSSSSQLTQKNDIAAKTLIYFAQYDNFKLERRQFILETYTIFASLQNIAQEAEDARMLTGEGGYKPAAIPPPPALEHMQYFNRISKLYREAVVEQLPIIEADTKLSDEGKVQQLTHHATLLSTLALAEILYLPSDGRGEGLVGEEILDWVNTIDRAPSAEEGAQLAPLSRPWEHPNFWPYIYRCILRGHLLSVRALLDLLRTHPSNLLQELGKLIVGLLEGVPRSSAFRSEGEWEESFRKWKWEVKEKSEEMEELIAEGEDDEVLGGSENEEVRFEWEAGFRCLFEMLEGKEKRVLEASEDWREAVGAWGLWVNPGGRREDLPDTLALILEHHPIDGTLPSEALQSSLIQGDAVRALQQANLISTWLVAHLSDLFSKLNILPTPLLREYFVLSYADLLLADAGLWRVVVDYLVTCGEVGRVRAEKVLERVCLEDVAEEVKEGEGGVEDDGSEKENQDPFEKVRVVEDVLRVCAELGLEDTTKKVCKIYSEMLVGQKKYGEAVSFCVRAGDPKRIARIADRVLEEYVVNGQEAFICHVDSIPTSLLRPTSRQDGANSEIDIDLDEDELLEPSVPPIPRLAFLARYRDFFALYARGERREAAGLLLLLLTSGVAPKRFYAVMFLDVLPLLQASEILISLEETYELLRCLEEITSCISPAGEDIYGYLIPLARIVGAGVSEKDGTKVAMKQLDVVRGALALHLGRCCAL